MPGMSEEATLREATQVLLDLGFAVEESSSSFGVLVGSKQRDARETGQIVGAVALSVVSALLLVPVLPTWDEDQTIRATITTRASASLNGTQLRVSFERRVRNNQGHSRFEALDSPEMYSEFTTLLRRGSDPVVRS
jgi:hypothetical protein